MSARLMSRALESDLDGDLKMIAVCYASFADDAGNNVRPSIERIAWMAGRSTRQAQRHTATLRRLGVLQALTDLRGGSGRVVRYRFVADALPGREPFAPTPKARHPRQGFEADNHVTDDAVNHVTYDVVANERPAENHVVGDVRRVTSSAETTTPVTKNHVTGDTRSVSDPSVDPSEEEERGADAPPVPAEDEVRRRVGQLRAVVRTGKQTGECAPRTPRGPVVGAVAVRLLGARPDVEFSDLKELVKGECSRLQIPYDSESVGKAVDSAYARQGKVAGVTP